MTKRILTSLLCAGTITLHAAETSPLASAKYRWDMAASADNISSGNLKTGVAQDGAERKALPDQKAVSAEVPSFARGGEATLYVRFNPKDGFPRGTIVSGMSASSRFTLAGWRMPFLEREHLAFHLIIAGRKLPRIAGADLDRIPVAGVYVVVIRKLKDEVFEFWVNGELFDSRVDLDYSASTAGGAVRLARVTGTPGLTVGSLFDGTEPFAGTVETVGAWDRAISDGELAELFGRPLGRELCVAKTHPDFEQVNRELAFGRFGPWTNLSEIEQRSAALDEKIPSLRDELVRDDTNQFPRFHMVIPGEQWNPISFFHNGRYHLFQTWSAGGCFTYFSDAREGLHLQHLSSPDLVNWTFHPKPIRTNVQNENGTFFTDDKGVATFIFLGGHSSERPFVPRAESTDPDLERWTLFREKSSLLEVPDLFKQRQDPSAVFKRNGTWYLNTTIQSKNPKLTGTTIPLYTSKDAVEWNYAGPFYHHPQGNPANECGQMAFFPDGKAVYFLGHGLGETAETKDVGYLVGKIDPEGRFQVSGMGREGSNFHAPMLDDKGRVVTWYFQHDVRPFEESSGTGWKGILCLPTIVTVGADDTLRYRPAPELEALRSRHQEKSLPHLDAGGESVIGEGLDLRQCEIVLRVPAAPEGVQGIRLTDGRVTLEVAYDHKAREFVLSAQSGGRPVMKSLRMPAKRETPDTVQMRLFNDRGVIELFGDDDVHVSHHLIFDGLTKLRALVFTGNTALKDARADLWQMGAITWSQKARTTKGTGVDQIKTTTGKNQ